MSRSLDQPPPAADATLASGLRLGYACVNTQLPSSARTLRLANLTPARLRQLILANLDALEVIVRWNRDHGIQVFRLTSNLIPFASHPANTRSGGTSSANASGSSASSLRRAERAFRRIRGSTRCCRPKCPAWSTRPSPSSSTTTGCSRRSASTARTRSSSTSARARAIRTPHARASPRRSRGSREEPSPGSSSRTTSGGRFRSSSSSLSPLGIPVVFDAFHHQLARSLEGLELREVVLAAARTWRAPDGRQEVHFSTQEPGKRPGAHAETIDVEAFARFVSEVGDLPLDCILEVKDKEQSVLRARELFRVSTAP